jgi:hypothetical protein
MRPLLHPLARPSWLQLVHQCVSRGALPPIPGSCRVPTTGT